MNKTLTLEERWQKDLPIGLKDLATVMAVSYQVAWKWSKIEDFPLVCRMVRKSGFDAWWKRSARRTGKGRSRSLPAKGVDPQERRIFVLKRERESIEGEMLAENERTRRLQAETLFCDESLLRELPPKAAALFREARSHC